MKTKLFLLMFLLITVVVSKTNAQTLIDNTTCTDNIVPTSIGYSSVRVDGGLVVVYYQSTTPCYSNFYVVPIYVRGSIEQRITGLAVYTGGSQIYNFNKQQLIDAAVALGARPGSAVKYRFAVTTINNVLTSPEVKTVTESIR